VADFLGKILPICRAEPVGEKGFERLSRQTILSQRRKLSLVDLSGFDCMHRLGIKRVVAFDRHFDEQAFITPKFHRVVVRRKSLVPRPFGGVWSPRQARMSSRLMFDHMTTPPVSLILLSRNPKSPLPLQSGDCFLGN
jgi:hypothetical protein